MERTLKILKIFISCALGAGIGAFVALQLNQYLWWLGMIIGYLSYNFREVIKALPKAYKRAKGLVPDKEFILSAVYLILYIASWYFLFWALLTLTSRVHYADVLILVGFMSMLLSLFFVLDVILPRKNYDKISERCKTLFYFGNPVSSAFYLLPKGTFGCIIRIPSILCFAGRFFKHLFLLIHSDIRLLCGIDAAIGAGIGYFAGNAIIGAIAGGIFGVINYKVISQKLLKLHLKTNH